MKQPLFYTRIPKIYSIVLGILWVVISIATLGLLLNYSYDFCLHHRYWVNRRILYRYLVQTDLVYTKREIIDNLTEYKFETFNIWVWNKQLQVTVNIEHYDDVIGLFTSSKTEDRIVIKLIRSLNKLE